MNDTKPKFGFLVLLAIGVGLLLWQGGGLPFAVPGISKPTAVVYVYEKDSHAIPGPVSVAISKLNAQGILATHDEVDTKDGSGEVPEQYKVSRPAAVAAGLPALVVMAGERVVRTVKDPKTEAQVIEAAQ